MGYRLSIKNMVCPRCIRVVREEIEKLGYTVEEIRLGEVTLKSEPGDLAPIAKALQSQGFALLEAPNARLVNEIKIYIQELVRSGTLAEQSFTLSTLLADHFAKSYGHLSGLFSQSENQTMEHYFIAQKIEQAKEWLAYEELTLTEMAYQLGYNTVAHLSHQFKKTTGFSPSEFRKLKSHHRKPLSEL